MLTLLLLAMAAAAPVPQEDAEDLDGAETLYYSAYGTLNPGFYPGVVSYRSF